MSLDASRHQTVMEGCLFWGLWGSDAKKFSSHKGFPGQPMMCFSCDLVHVSRLTSRNPTMQVTFAPGLFAL